MKKLLITVTLILLAGVVGTYFYFSGKEYVYRFTEGQLQEKLDARLPMSRIYYFIFEVTLDHPRITLTDGSDKIAAGLDIVLNVRVGNEPKPLGGSIDVSGGIRYAADTGEFFLTDPVVDRLSVQGIPEQHTQKAGVAIAKALAEYYADHPVYSLAGTDAKKLAARLVLKKVVVENQVLIVTLGI